MVETSKEIANLLTFAKKFRQAIIKMRDKYNLKSTRFANFPKGKCEYTSYLLMKYLEEEGSQGLTLWKGLIKMPDFNHVWLQVNNICIDITADQFNNGDFIKIEFVLPEEIVVECRENYPLINYLTGIKKKEITQKAWKDSEFRDDLELIKKIINGEDDFEEYYKGIYGLSG